MSIRMSIGLVVLAVVGVAGCAQPDVGDPATAPAEGVIVAQSALTGCGCSNSSYTTVSAQGGPVITNFNNNEYLCWGTKFVHTELDADFSVNLTVYPASGGKWVVWGTGEATCVPQCCFYSNGGSSDVRWLSSSFGAESQRPSPVSDLTDMWQDDSMPILTGVQLSANDNATEQVSTWLQAPYNQLKSWTIAGPSGTTTSAWGVSFFVGTPASGHEVQYVQYGWTDNSTHSHISASAGICGLRSLHAGGDRPDEGTLARIYRSSNGIWKSTSTDTDIQVRCFYFDQDQ